MSRPKIFPPHRANRLPLRIFLTVFFVCAFFTNRYLTTNDASRFSLTVSLVEFHAPEIGAVLPRAISKGWKVMDYARVKDPGGRAEFDRILSDKPPLGSFAAVPAYFAASRLKPPFGWVVYCTSLSVSGVATAWTAVLLFKLMRRNETPEGAAALLALSYGVGTMALVYGTVLFSSALTAFCALAAFYLLSEDGETFSAWKAALGGALATAAAASDYYAAIASAGLLGLAAARRRFVVPALLGAAAPVLLLALYHDWAFGAPWPLSYRYAHLYEALHAKGFYGLSAPSAEHARRLAAALFSKEGFVAGNLPALAGFAGLAAMWRRRRAEAVMIVFLFVGFAYLNSSESWLDAYSARFFMPVLPFLTFAAGFLNFKDRRVVLCVGAAALAGLFLTLRGVDAALPEFKWEVRPGMQNVASDLLGPRGVRLGWGNLIFLAVPVAAVWIFGRERRGEKSGRPQ